ncbi:glycosyl hydrolase family 18 protein [uncultured Lacinutrix sp.]|uniref:glycosyl hydrolase family 18 protein n=1 Tax=uncultured Lacinutrix sp. TaxID=574032 RepID=UPI00261E19A4|nr:glycosyl hydrolase family 18 protein [uncultured Lacinutrix sp.]
MKTVLITLMSLCLLISCKVDNKSKVKDENQVITTSNDSYISQRHLNDEKNSALNLKTEAQWDSLNNTSNKKILHAKGNVHPDIRTFGWHIYSNGSTYKNYNFSMLWGISYFSYAVEPNTGSYKSIHQWKTTPLIDSAKAKGCKVFLSVSNFGSKNNSVFLDNPKAQKTLIDSISNLLALRAANGINIDFEGVPKKSKTHFTKFIIQISKALKQKNPDYMVSLCLYAIDWKNIFDIKAINSHVDFYTLMGYDYYGSFSKTTGPVTPLKTSTTFGNGLEHSINHYKNKGVPLNKLIAGLPYYGAEWYTQKPNIGAAVTTFKSHPPYKAIRKLYIDSLNIPVKFDSKSASSYIIIKDNTKHYRQLFFEDEKSLSMTYNWIKSNKIGGVGIWALGYDDGYPELWNLLAKAFSQEQNTTLYNDK